MIKRHKHLSIQRKIRVRGSFSKSLRPRLAVYKSNQRIYAQVIGTDGKILASAFSKKNVGGALEVGQKMAVALQKIGVKSVVFDRGSFRYDGLIKKLATSCREGGLEF